jgi:hypothetical protein
MGIELSKSQLEESDVNEISRFITNIVVDYKNYEATIVRSGWNGEYVVFQYENNSLDLENIGGRGTRKSSQTGGNVLS